MKALNAERDKTDKDNGRIADFRSATSVLLYNQSLLLFAVKTVHTLSTRLISSLLRKICSFNLFYNVTNKKIVKNQLYVSTFRIK